MAYGTLPGLRRIAWASSSFAEYCASAIGEDKHGLQLYEEHLLEL